MSGVRWRRRNSRIMVWEKSNSHMGDIPWNYQSVIPNKRSSSSSNSLLAILRERYVRGPGVSPIQGPLGLAMSYYKDPRRCHNALFQSVLSRERVVAKKEHSLAKRPENLKQRALDFL
jgi:hypothetical protein